MRSRSKIRMTSRKVERLAATEDERIIDSMRCVAVGLAVGWDERPAPAGHSWWPVNSDMCTHALQHLPVTLSRAAHCCISARHAMKPQTTYAGKDL